MKTPLHFAAKGRCENIVIFLLSNGADVNAVDEVKLTVKCNFLRTNLSRFYYFSL